MKNSDGWTFKVPQGVPKVDADQAIESARSCGVRHQAFTQKGAAIVAVLVLLNIHGPRGQEDTDSPFMLKDRLVYVVQASDVEIAYSPPTVRTEPLVARSVVQFAIDAVTGGCLKVRDFGTVAEPSALSTSATTTPASTRAASVAAGSGTAPTTTVPSEDVVALTGYLEQLRGARGFVAGGIDPVGAIVNAHWTGEPGTDARAVIGRARADGVTVEIRSGAYDLRDLLAMGSILWSRLERDPSFDPPIRINTAGYTGSREISFGGPRISTDPDMQRQVRRAATTMFGDVRVVFVPDPGMIIARGDPLPTERATSTSTATG